MKWLQASISFLVFSLSLYSQVPSVLAQSYSNTKTKQISQKLPTSIDNQSKLPALGFAARFKPPVDDQPNPPTVGAATRGSSCLKNQQEITALIPANKSALTLNEHPTFFWHIPQISEQTAEFALINDAEEKVIYKTNLTLPKQPGIISFTLPKNAPELTINTTYRWYLTLICDEEDSSKNPYVEGFVKRIPANLPLSESLVNADLLQKSTFYAQAGIWHEALSSFVELRCTEPNNQIVKIHWRQFLDSVGLNNIASEPLVDSCTTKN
ncbi:DUF928 domain-containing protein [Anabaena azotica]|uniref:DUF928 domain-containing protein n=1 Tax=Anabaena azotica TaxID=197653 RepID=UPI0039A4857D